MSNTRFCQAKRMMSEKSVYGSTDWIFIIDGIRVKLDPATGIYTDRFGVAYRTDDDGHLQHI